MSTLESYLDRFTGTPDYRCDTTDSAPIILDGKLIVDSTIRADREKAIIQATEDFSWKERIGEMMEDDLQAASVGLPTRATVMNNSDSGRATLVPMIVAWRVAAIGGLMSREAFRCVCENQVRLLEDAIVIGKSVLPPRYLLDSLAAYQSELSKLSMRDLPVSSA